jgi:RNA polymerase sigma factor (TIGR02999 family)
MPAPKPEEISRLLLAWNEGDDAALRDLVPVVYPELRRIARQYLARREPGHTLESAALANDVYLQLVRSRGISCTNRGHFFAVCAQMIRRILVDHARSRQYAKRGGKLAHVPLDEALLGLSGRGIEIMELDEALKLLAELDERKVRVVELRFFGGLSVDETSEVLGISAETVMRDWRFAKTWLGAHLRSSQRVPQHNKKSQSSM